MKIMTASQMSSVQKKKDRAMIGPASDRKKIGLTETETSRTRFQVFPLERDSGLMFFQSSIDNHQSKVSYSKILAVMDLLNLKDCAREFE